ncbi:hypothetical protein EUBDOL_02236 [Amedibacillus dolichus DSM 3991]|uniref:Uncharacterized protein n=1 Tax=Amedibacillus dolichus DSM 3991 TaxID=428127 RepID=A8RFG4_9FIRM|nr:hypothetical protein EUBDOL_02236 [Amedibacillus dolichus DSM 3991]
MFTIGFYAPDFVVLLPTHRLFLCSAVLFKIILRDEAHK